MRQAGRALKGELVPQIGRKSRGGVDASATRQLKLVCGLKYDIKARRGRRFFRRVVKRLWTVWSPVEGWCKRLAILRKKRWGKFQLGQEEGRH